MSVANAKSHKMPCFFVSSFTFEVLFFPEAFKAFLPLSFAGLFFWEKRTASSSSLFAPFFLYPKLSCPMAPLTCIIVMCRCKKGWSWYGINKKAPYLHHESRKDTQRTARVIKTTQQINCHFFLRRQLTFAELELTVVE